jgi:hypothetical protein
VERFVLRDVKLVYAPLVAVASAFTGIFDALKLLPVILELITNTFKLLMGEHVGLPYLQSKKVQVSDPFDV